jgi:Mg-chelatase subunit ChlD
VSEKLDKPSDIEFAQALVDNIPHPGKTELLQGVAAAYLVSKAVKRVIKKR